MTASDTSGPSAAAAQPLPSATDPDTSASLTGRVARGAAWTTISRVGAQLFQFASSLVLARFLSPHDFGLFVSVLVVTTFAQIFFEFGMTGALIQMRDLREEDLSTVFWLNALGGVAFAALMTALGPVLAAFFDEPQLVSLTPVVALTFMLHLGACHQALLERAMRFGRLTGVELVASLVGFIVSVVLAVNGAGVYALPIGTIVSNVLATAGFWLSVRWRPHSFISRSSLAKIWRFSSGVVGFQVVDYWGSNLDNALIGRFSGPAPLGLYNRAYNFMQIPVLQVGMVLGRVIFPALASLRDDPARAGRAYVRALRMVSALGLPVLAGIAVVSPSLVPLLWGDRWTRMVPLLAVLCLAGMPLAVTVTTSWVYQAVDRTDIQFKMGLVTLLIGVTAMAVGIHWGALGVAWAVAFRSWSTFWPQMHVCAKTIGIHLRELIDGSARTLVVTAAMALLAWSVPWALGWDRSSVVTLVAQVLVGVVVYGGGSLLVQREVISELRALAGSRRSAH